MANYAKKTVRKTAGTTGTGRLRKKKTPASAATATGSASSAGGNGAGGNGSGGEGRLLEVLTAFGKGDFSQRMPLDEIGVMGKIYDALNNGIDLSQNQSKEVNRIAEVVGREGRFTQRAAVGNLTGSWADSVNAVNTLIDDLVQPTTEVARVISAVASGDLSQKVALEIEGRPVGGEFLQAANNLNTMVDQLNAFAGEVTRVAQEVGTEGKLGGQAVVEGVTGTWLELTNNVNTMASNLTEQVREIARVVTAVADGNLDEKIVVEVRGEVDDLKQTINTMVDRLNVFADEVSRVAQEVGTEGKMGGQATVEGARGSWRLLTDNVNRLASNLTEQVRDIAAVTTAVANGDLSKKITVEVRSEVEELKETINTMVDQLGNFSDEVTRVAREVGTEGVLGGQAEVRGVGGVWLDLTNNVNTMASNLTDQVRNVVDVVTAVAQGDLSRKVSVEARGEVAGLADTINVMVDQLNAFSSEVTRIAREVGTEGKLGGQAVVEGVSGTWLDLTNNVNTMAGNLTEQVRNIAEVTTAVAQGDLSRKITVEVRGEVNELKETINTMVDQLGTFAAEVTRVAQEVGTEGVLGGQAQVLGVSGTWLDLTNNVNTMASNLTDQVRDIAAVTTAVANGDLSKKITVEVRGEVLDLKNTINTMVDQLGTFADEVTRVARDVGTEGKLGVQAEVRGVAGTWRDLTDNVNELAGNLTTQMRAIADVAIAVNEGDLTRKIEVEARGEVAALADNLNQMVGTLAATSQTNTDQDWLKTSLATLTRITTGANDLGAATEQILQELAPMISASHAVIYMAETKENQPTQLVLSSTYAFKERKHVSNVFQLGEGLVGQCAVEKRRILLTDVPGDYIQISSGLGEATPMNIAVLPLIFENDLRAVIELASFTRYTEIQIDFMEQLSEALGIGFNAITATQRNEELLAESQTLTEELQTQQEELQQTNEELEEKGRLVEDQKQDVERKNEQVGAAKADIEEKARQLELTSRYKSEFLANMSHELRTPLNSLLILAKTLSDNPDENLSAKQVEYAETIHGSGADLLNLINEILDLSKIESGLMAVESQDVPFADIEGDTERNFRQVADEKKLGFAINLDAALPGSIHTDPSRLLQVLKNLLSNAFKFTERGEVALRIAPATSGWTADNDLLNRAASVVAFAVSDTGVGIPEDKQLVIFEAFQQADGGHRPGPVHQPRDRPPVGWRNPPGQHTRQRQHVHALLTAPLHSAHRRPRRRLGRRSR